MSLRERVPCRNGLAHLWSVQALVQGQVLRRVRRWLWTVHPARVQRCHRHVHVLPMRSIHGHGQRHPLPRGQHAPCGAALRPIRRVGPRPHPAEGRRGPGPIHRLPDPCDPLGAVRGHQARCPHRPQHACLPPGLQPVMDTAACSHTAGQRFPWSACSSHREERIEQVPVVMAWASALRFRRFDGS